MSIEVRYDMESAFRRERPLIVLRGKTGSGKTAVLRALAARGVHVLDLEAMAGHRGSAFGGLGLPPQPSREQFQAALADAWCGLAPERVVFSEHEGPYIGSVGLPAMLFQHLWSADWIRLSAPLESRIERIVMLYGSMPASDLEHALQRMRARLGLQTTRQVCLFIRHGQLRDAVRELIPYYDRAYAHQLASVGGRMLHVIAMASRSCEEVAEEILRDRE